MSEVLNNSVLVALGWLLGVFSQGIERRRLEYVERRRILTRLDRILEDIFIDIELTKAMKEAGVIQTMQGMFDLDESWVKKIPAHLSDLPDDYDRVVDDLGDWEARQGKYNLYKSLVNLKKLMDSTKQVYAALEAVAKQPDVEIPERPLKIYEVQIIAVKKATSELLGVVRDARRSSARRLAMRLKKRWLKKPAEKLKASS
jgi:hypothetical protein